MKLCPAIRAAIAVVIILGSPFVFCARDYAGGAASVAPTKRSTKAIRLPASQRGYYPDSVTFSPNGRWLAVGVGNYWVGIRDVRSNRWIRSFREVFRPRWHPSKPVLIAAGGSAYKPAFYIAYLSSGRIHQLFRGDFFPFAWTTLGMTLRGGIVDFAKSGEHGAMVRNFGYRVPWDYDLKGEVMFMSSGPADQIAAEVQPYDVEWGGRTQWVETYRRVPWRKQWVTSGKIRPCVKGPTVVWYPKNPVWLGDGRLVYLRIYPAQWTPLQTSNGSPNPKARGARNRAELWVCNADGTRQNKITTLWDLKPYTQNPEADWITVDRQGRNVYYISGKVIRHICIAGK